MRLVDTMAMMMQTVATMCLLLLMLAMQRLAANPSHAINIIGSSEDDDDDVLMMMLKAFVAIRLLVVLQSPNRLLTVPISKRHQLFWF